MNNTYLNKERIGQTHSECICSADLSVMLTNKEKATKTQIIEKDGTICNFPGIERCQALCDEIDVDNIRPKVYYSSSFQKCDNGQYLMIWTVRPDGRFWMDSWGFGAEFDGRDVFLSDKAENLFPAMVKFFNLAVLLSEFGHDIAVRKR
jgi:hypothetical protein